MKKYFFLLIITLLAACSGEKLKTGLYRSVLSLNPGEDIHLPFMLEVEHDGQGYLLTMINGEERITVDDYTLEKGKITFLTPVFASGFRGDIRGDRITGAWLNYSGGDTVRIPWSAEYGEESRFAVSEAPEEDISGTWEVHFGHSVAVGEFQQEEEVVSGTVITETGDYRFLQGVLDGRNLKLSTFDGAHAFLFDAEIRADTLRGLFYSGPRYKARWWAVRNSDAALTDPYALTYLKEGYDSFTFAFPDPQGDTLSLEDPRFRNKVVMVQIMGSWCPNCMDETALYSRLYQDYQDQGLEIVALGFEKVDDPESVQRNFNRLRERFDVEYPILWAGPSGKTEAAEALPMLNHVLSYPTTVFLDREGKVRKIHTGFYGKGTGEYYDQFVQETRDYIELLLNE